MFRQLSSRRIVAGSSAILVAGAAYSLFPSASLDSPTAQKRKYTRPGPLWSPPTRAQMIASLKASGVVPERLRSGTDPKEEEIFDLLIVGGGATGAGTALDAASRGLKVGLVERDDFSSGTSSKSTKLVHGGVRYLQKAIFELDYEQWKLVKEALKERRVFLETAPYLSAMLPILLPVYTYWQLPYFFAGTKLYDILAGSDAGAGSYLMGKGKTMDSFPMLKSEGLKGSVVYYDGQHNDSRMNMALIMTAVHHGATAANYTEVVALNKGPDGKLCGARLKDVLTGDEWDVKAKGIINATGPFADGLRKLDDPTVQQIVAPSSGVHITLPNYYGPKSMGLLDPATSDGRVIFFLPWQGNVIAGTTDAPTSLSQNPNPSEEDIMWILNEVKNYLSPDVKVRRGDVLSAWSGIRPLVKDPAAKDTQSLVRNHLINVSESGLLTISGGKWTTYRAMAEETVDRAVKEYNLKPKGPCDTDHIKLLGAHGWTPLMFIKLIQQFGLETDVAKHLAENYGDRAWTICSMAEPTGLRWPLHGVRMAPAYPFIEAECRYACRFEYAQHAADFLGRRARLSFLDCDAALDALPRVIEIMGEELGWNKSTYDTEFAHALEYLKSMGLSADKYDLKFGDIPRIHAKVVPKAPTHDEEVAFSRASFTPAEVLKLQERFRNLDFDHDNQITVADLQHAMAKMGYANATHEQVENILAEVDYDRNGAIFFDDFLDIAAGLKELHIETAFSNFTLGDDSNIIGSKTQTERLSGGA